MRRINVASAACAALALAFLGCTRTVDRGLGRPGERIQLMIKDKVITVEVANDELSRQEGLMHRPSMPEDAGMIFIFSELKQRGFWMKNTLIPLSIAFLDDSGKILQIEDMRPKDESTTESNSLVRHALEMNQGWFARNGIGVGDSFAGFQEAVGRYRGI